MVHVDLEFHRRYVRAAGAGLPRERGRGHLKANPHARNQRARETRTARHRAHLLLMIGHDGPRKNTFGSDL
jgi:hypothetical protein